MNYLNLISCSTTKQQSYVVLYPIYINRFTSCLIARTSAQMIQIGPKNKLGQLSSNCLLWCIHKVILKRQTTNDVSLFPPLLLFRFVVVVISRRKQKCTVGNWHPEMIPINNLFSCKLLLSFTFYRFLQAHLRITTALLGFNHKFH